MNSGISMYRRAKSAGRGPGGRAAAIHAAANLAARAVATAEALEPRRLLATFTVTSTADLIDSSDGINTLREAITESNTLPGVDRIEFSIATPAPHIISPTSMLPSILTGCVIDGTTQPGYGNSPIIRINGASAPAGADGLRVGSLGSRISGLVITRFGAQAIQVTALANQNVIFGNYIGVEADGVTPAPNARGIFISGFNNVIGGITPQERNVISGNAGAGIQINNEAADNNNVRGNYIGTNASGSAAVGDGTAGVLIIGGADNNMIGTNGNGADDAAEGNLISGNRDGGVRISGSSTNNNVVAGNRIGTNAAGTAALGNVNAGIHLVGATSTNRIGNDGNSISEGLERNIISGTLKTLGGQGGDGIRIQALFGGSQFIAGNFIGTDITGSAALGNAGFGVMVEQGSSVSIGRDTDDAPDVAEGNLISGNLTGGILLTDPQASSVFITGNRIGTDITGLSALGNNGPGVRINDGSSFNNVIGNAIRHNAGAGVELTLGGLARVPRFNVIRANSIDSNGGLGIDLGGDGVTPNDPFDFDDGPNSLNNAPLIDSFTSPEPGVLEVTGHLNLAPFRFVTIDIYATPAGAPGDVPEGARYIGQTFAFTNDVGQGPVFAQLSATLAPGEMITATANDGGGTSEFSGRVSASAGGPYFFDEGTGVAGVLSIPLDGTGVDLGGDAVTHAWDLDNDGDFDDSTVLNPTLTIPDEGPASYVVSLRVTNSAGQTATDTTTVQVFNVAPVLLSLTANSDENNPLKPGGSATLSGSFTDVGLLDTHTLRVDWGDGNIEETPTARASGSADGSFSRSHTYAAAGVYTILTDVIDDDGYSAGGNIWTVYVTGASNQFGIVNIIGTTKSDHVTLTGNPDGSLSVAASFLPSVLHFASGDVGGVNVYLSAKNDEANVIGSVINLMISGGEGNDAIKSGDGNAYLFGGPGNDVLTGGAGFNNMYGGAGNDQIDAGSGSDPFVNDVMYGEEGNDTIIARATFAYADGGAGNDTFISGSGGSNFFGGDGNDKATGGSGQDSFYGGLGNDELDGAGESDALYGEDGNDILRGGDGADIIQGGRGNDKMEGGAGDDYYDFETVLFGTTEADSVTERGPAENTLSFASVFGSDDGIIVDLTRSADAVRHRNGSRSVSLSNAASIRTVIGGWGDDLMTGNALANTFNGYEGNDTLFGAAGNDELQGSGGDDEIHGGAGNDTLYGSYGNDRLFGDAGNDLLTGDDFPGGVDTINGGADTDTLGDPGDPSDLLESIELP